jgi:hypothetical protein
MRASENVPPLRGEFTLLVWRRGELIEEYADGNLIVDASKAVMANLIGGSVTNRSISQISFGTNGTAADPANTAITSPYTKPLDGVTYPSNGSAQFAFSLGSGEANGMSIIEFGLLTGGSTLFARKVRSGAIAKASDLSFTGTWRIIF